MALYLTSGWIFSKPGLLFGDSFPQLFFTQLKYRGGKWDPNPLFIEALIEELELRTSIDASRVRRIMELSDPDLFFAKTNAACDAVLLLALHGPSSTMPMQSMAQLTQ